MSRMERRITALEQGGSPLLEDPNAIRLVAQVAMEEGVDPEELMAEMEDAVAGAGPDATWEQVAALELGPDWPVWRSGAHEPY